MVEPSIRTVAPAGYPWAAAKLTVAVVELTLMPSASVSFVPQPVTAWLASRKIYSRSNACTTETVSVLSMVSFGEVG